VATRLVQLRGLAAADIDAAIDHYQQSAGEAVALDLVDALEHAVTRISRSPHVGSLRFSHELAIPELRAWTLQRFPYLIFYVPNDKHIDVWRVLHSRRDIPSELSRDP